MSFKTHTGLTCHPNFDRCTHANKFGYDHISVGDLLREEKDKPGSVFGAFITESIQNSVIVPPSLTLMLLKNKMQKVQGEGRGVLLDGFPRSVSQAVAFEQEVCIGRS